MNLAYRQLKVKIPSFNERTHNETDFYRIAKKLRIIVDSLELDCQGCFVSYQGQDFIFLDQRRKGLERTEIQFHELAHAAANHPCEFLKFRLEKQAEAFAVVFLISLKDLFEFASMPFEEIDLRLIPYLKKRWHIFQQYGF